MQTHSSPGDVRCSAARLDKAVFAAYDWPPDISDEEIMKNLLALNLERYEQGAVKNLVGGT